VRIISKKHRVDIGAQTPIPRAPKEAALPRLIVARVLAQDGRKTAPTIKFSTMLSPAVVPYRFA